MRPLIGIPPCLDEQERWRKAREYHYADSAYARAVSEAGGLPIYLPLQSDVAALVARLDGLLLPGGGDFVPERSYPAGVAFDPVPARQLAFDRALLAVAVAGVVAAVLARTWLGSRITVLGLNPRAAQRFGVDAPLLPLRAAQLADAASEALQVRLRRGTLVTGNAALRFDQLAIQPLVVLVAAVDERLQFVHVGPL